ncbi:MAG: hypothetical protein IJM20_03070 [Clostridia bacterium]|nr:hypothetical protein [Clostridia bacterium]
MMKTIAKIMALVFAAALVLPLFACGKKSDVETMLKREEVDEFNAELVAPYKLGESEETLKKGGYESYSGIEHHYMRYHSPSNQDVGYSCGTYELHYGEPDPKLELYVVGIRITPQGKTIQKNEDGSTTPVYTTSRSIFGIKVGDNIETARQILLGKGYTVIYEDTEKVTPNGLPKSREITFRKGVIMFSMGVERTDDISQISIWVPYYEPQIETFNSQSHLPADLGLQYSVLLNKDFAYAGKNQTSRKYETPDGSVAIMRGFPDYTDMMMTAEVSFTSDKYDVLGVKVGMTEDEAVNKLTALGCTEESGGIYTYNSVAAIKLEVSNGVVVRVAAVLRPSTDLSGITAEPMATKAPEGKDDKISGTIEGGDSAHRDSGLDGGKGN